MTSTGDASTPDNVFSVLKSVLDRLDQCQIPYMVVGSIATIVYGEPRMTRDVDLVVELQPLALKKLIENFPESDFYVPPVEVISDEVVNRRQFNLIHHASGFKIDVIVRKVDPHSVVEFTRRRRISLGDRFEIWVASPEDVILKKLKYFQEGGSHKHLTDIAGVLAHQPVDARYIADWAGKMGLSAEWARVSGGE